ncbi:hypothetical protein I4U23_029754 [Adineta vaga]|nr:hypothetical protein I4U23_029754 [Adineta vaga]
MIIKRVFEGFTVLFCSSSFLISFAILIFIVTRVRPFISDVSILLTCNTYVTLIGSSFMTLLIMIYSVYGGINQPLSFDDYACQLRSYVNYVFITGFYYSCAIQAAFRFSRVVFAKYRILQSHRMFDL